MSNVMHWNKPMSCIAEGAPTLQFPMGVWRQRRVTLMKATNTVKLFFIVQVTS